MLDDASTDGTSEAIAEQFPEITVLHGDGKQYWNGGMRRAFGAAIAQDYDYYLWMNDDTCLDDGALALLLDAERFVRERGATAGDRRRFDQASRHRRADLRGRRARVSLAAAAP